MNPTKINKMKQMKQILSISMIAAVSSVQAAPVILDPALADKVIVAETYTSLGAKALVHGSINSGTYTSVGAGITGAPTDNIATVHGNINSGTYTSTGNSAIVDGNITNGTYTSIGAFSNVGSNVTSGTYTTTGANSNVTGNINAGGVLTLGAGATVGGTATGSLGGPPPVAPNLQSNIQAQQASLKGMSGTTLGTGVFGASTSFAPGVYNFTDILSFAADTNITLNGDGSDQSWVFNVGNYMSLGANVDVILNNVGTNSSVFWNILGDSTGGAGLGYASLGAGVDFRGIILANSYISVGADYAMVSGIGNSCGGLYSATGYVSIGATSIVGGEGCGLSVALPSEIPPSAVPDSGSSLAFLGLGLLSIGGMRCKFSTARKLLSAKCS